MITGTLKGDIQYVKSIFLGDYEFLKFIDIKLNNELKSIPLLKADEYVNMINDNNLPNAMICVCPLKYVFSEKSIGWGIFVNNSFLNDLDDEEQLSVIYHELGHYVFHHLTKKAHRKYDINKELEADDFARKYGYGLALVRALKKTIDSRYDETDTKIRIKSLEENLTKAA